MIWVLILVAAVGLSLTFIVSPRLRKRSLSAMNAEFAIRAEIERWRELGPARRLTERLWYSGRVALIVGTFLWSGCIGVGVTMALMGRLS